MSHTVVPSFVIGIFGSPTGQEDEGVACFIAHVESSVGPKEWDVLCSNGSKNVHLGGYSDLFGMFYE